MSLLKALPRAHTQASKAFPGLIRYKTPCGRAIIPEEKEKLAWHHDPTNLPPQDTGATAWKVLIGSSVIQAVAWSLSESYGVFREYYFTHPPFAGIDILAITGVTSDGCLALLIPFLLSITKRFPAWRKRMIWLGMLICILASLGAGFSRSAWQIITTQGAMYGIGAGFLTAPTIAFVAEWFDKRQSFAYGVLFGASRLFGSFLPFVYTSALHRFGQRRTLIGHGCSVLLLTISALFCIRPRVPLPPYQRKIELKKNYDFVRKTSFYLLGAAVVIQGLVLNLPAIYLPSFTTDLNYSPIQGAITISLFNLSTWGGQIGFGMLADYRRSFYSSLFLSTIISGLCVFLFWGEAKTLNAIVIFAFLYGSTSGGFGSLRSRLANTVIGNELNKEQALTVFGIFTAGRGASSVAGGFIGQTLVNESMQIQFMAYGMRKWTPLIFFIALGMLAVAVLGLVQWLIERSSKRQRAASLNVDSNVMKSNISVASTLV